MIYAPEAHEQLAGPAWDAGWVRDRIERIADRTEGEIGPDGLWAEHPLDHEDGFEVRSGLYLGAAGVLWALHCLGRDHAGRFAAVHERYLTGSDWPGVEPAYIVGEAGILAAWLAVDPGAGVADRLEEVVRSNAENPTNELLWGAPGTMAAAVVLHGRTGEERWAAAFRESADELISRWLPADDGTYLWTQDLYGKTWCFIGSGHGFAGNVLSLHLGRDLLDQGAVDEIERRAVATATALAVREDGMANWPALAGKGLVANDTIRTQWCHGAPGMVTSLAGMAPKDEAFTALLVEAGELTWKAGPLTKGAGLCHGTAGNGLAFLSLFDRTGDERWLARARAFAVHALVQVEAGWEQYGAGRHSLWTGDVGAALMAESCIEPRQGMPSLDWL
jgi:hypothetical protein